MSTASIPDQDTTALPPQNVAAEQSVLGGMMLSKGAIGVVVDVVRSEDFYRPAHQAVYDAILDLYGRGEPADAITVSAELERRQELLRVGGAPYMHTLIATVPTAANADYYAKIVAETAVLRRLTEAGTRIAQLGYNSGDGDDAIEQAQTALYDAVTSRDSESQETGAEELFGNTLAAIEEIAAGSGKVGLPTGFVDLDSVIGGLKPGELTIIAARPGVGKSVLAMDMVREASIHRGKRSLVFSLEMSAEQLGFRLLAAESQVRLGDMQHGRLAPEDWARVRDRMGALQQAPMLINDTASITMPEIRSRAQRQAMRDGLDLIVVDYMQLMTSGKKVESRQTEVSEFSRGLKLLAKDLGVPVVALSQLNRGPEAREGKKPQLSDLRESGSIEQDADMVILIDRPDAYDRADPRMGEADLILAKHRGGPTSTITVAHQLHYSRFVDMAQGWDVPADDPAFERDNVRPMTSSSAEPAFCVSCGYPLGDETPVEGGRFHRACAPGV